MKDFLAVGTGISVTDDGHDANAGCDGYNSFPQTLASQQEKSVFVLSTSHCTDSYYLS
jgi:hypothetical protein